MFAVVAPEAAASVIDRLDNDGIASWVAGTVSTTARDVTGFEQGAKGVDGGAVRLVGRYAD
jgi:phosphoribosylformylglycinamidine cyclo-ligase